MQTITVFATVLLLSVGISTAKVVITNRPKPREPEKELRELTDSLLGLAFELTKVAQQES